jgi:hypothetical protein
MSNTAANEWLELNQRYLAAALAWLRKRLEHHARHWHLPIPAVSSAPPPPEPVSQQEKQGFWQKRQSQPVGQAQSTDPTQTHGTTPRQTQDTGTSSIPTTTISMREITKPTEMIDIEQQNDQLPALLVLSQLLSLSEFERDVLLLCIAVELDIRIAGLCGRAQGDQNKTYPTFALALSLFDEPRWDVMSPERPLRYWRLLEINQPAAQALSASPLRADERIVNYVQGLNYLDDRLASLITPLHTHQGNLPPSQQADVDAILRIWHHAAHHSSSMPVIQLVGPDVLSKHLVAAHVANNLRLHLYRMPIELLPSQANDLETLARLWQRESILFSAALYLEAQEMDGATANEGQALALNRFLDRSEGFFFLGVREVWPRLTRQNRIQDIAQPTIVEQEAAWTEALQGSAPGSPAQLSSQFNLNVTTIHAIARLERATGDPATLPIRLWDACRLQVRPRLDALAQRLDPKATWNDLVLPDEATNILHQIADQVKQRHKVYETWGFAKKMNRGLGINTLFSGESGTGKTMAAEVIANALRLDLYRIDLSAVVSKYIGETEKNLRRLFDVAEDGGAILFFDEADALFGKRSEVKDSHDRYANIEINYLLQRMEAYGGLAILATNMKSSLDPAFTRRLRFSVNFPFPGISERKRMWERVFPPQTPTSKLDYDRLARFSLTGGSIHNVALNAAFLAAQAGTAVTMQHILTAIRAEFRKLEKPINEADFRLQAQPSTHTTTGGHP